jgi:CRP/FNR family transcriptional regulator, cyclic AMP receptor protein
MASPAAADLASTALFAQLDEQSRLVLAGWLDSEEVPPGRELTHEGAAGYAFFVLHEGVADVLIDGGVVRTLGAGDYFGELSILGTGRQTATVRTTSPAVVWTMFGTRFRQLQIEHPEIAAVISQTASERLGERG